MKKTLIYMLAALIALLPLSGALAAGQERVILGTLPSPQGEIAELMAPAFQEMGYTLIVAPFPDESMLNEVLIEGSIDANFFQSRWQLDAYNAAAPEEERLIAVVPVYFVPFTLYLGAAESLETLKDNATVAVAQDEIGLSRSLLLLEEAGLIALRPEVTLEDAIALEDIVENPKSLQITPLADDALTASITEYDLAVIDGNLAEAAKILHERSVQSERAGSQAAERFAVTIAVRAADEKKGWIADLQSVLHSELIGEYLVARGYSPVFTLEDMEPEG